MALHQGRFLAHPRPPVDSPGATRCWEALLHRLPSGCSEAPGPGVAPPRDWAMAASMLPPGRALEIRAGGASAIGAPSRCRLRLQDGTGSPARCSATTEPFGEFQIQGALDSTLVHRQTREGGAALLSTGPTWGRSTLSSSPASLSSSALGKGRQGHHHRLQQALN